MGSTRIAKEISYPEFREIIDRYKGKITVSKYAQFRLNEAQRKVYKDDALINTLTEEKPTFIGIQQNGRYAAFYSRKEGYLRLIFSINKNDIEIVTFYIMDSLPKI